MLSQEANGLAWALFSIVLFGSFAVPIKTPAMQQARVQPVIIQVYKSTACFVTSWFVLLLRDFKFSYWGVIGAVIWVLNGIAAIAAVQHAGIGVSQATWSAVTSKSHVCELQTTAFISSLSSYAESSLRFILFVLSFFLCRATVIVSFVWGTVYYREALPHWNLALLGILLMTLGVSMVGFLSSGGSKASGSSSRHQQRGLTSYALVGDNSKGSDLEDEENRHGHKEYSLHGNPKGKQSECFQSSTRLSDNLTVLPRSHRI